MISDFWAGKRVFITGHTGFKGSWLAMALASQGAKLFGYALPPVEKGIFKSARVIEKFESSVYADVRDCDALGRALADSQANVVIHMAAQPLVRYSYDDPVGTYATNVMGTVHTLEAVRKVSLVRACVVVTSDKCYENQEWLWGYRENEAMGGYDPYSNSKGCSELVTSAYRRSFFSGAGAARIASGRAGNVIGGGDWSLDRLVPDLVGKFLAKEEVSIRNPTAIRPWQHVLDPIMGYVALAEKLLTDGKHGFDEGWNFGPDSDAERTVENVVTAVQSVWGEKTTWSKDGAPQPHEAHYLKLDSSKARRELNWRPVWGFDEAILRSVQWYLAEAAGEDMQLFTEEQLETYRADQRAFQEFN